MKRYRVFDFDIDTRASILAIEINEAWEDHVKLLHRENQERLKQQLLEEFGSHVAQAKLQNFEVLGPKPLSITAFHNKFLEQIRVAFVMAAYYPALTGACALGERILNHLIILLRNDFSSSPEFKYVYNKNSFQDWNKAIDILESWQVLLPSTAKLFTDLAEVRNRAIHFDPAVDNNDRELALLAIQLLSGIVSEQFTAFGRPDWSIHGTDRTEYFGSNAEPNAFQWFITEVPGEIYLKREVEELPFIKRVYVPHSFKVGPRHVVRMGFEDQQWIGMIDDRFSYEDREVTDSEFANLRRAAITEQQNRIV